MVISWEPYFLAIVWCINIWAEYLSLSLVSPHCLWCSRSWISQFTDIHTQIASVWTVSHTERLFKLVSIWWIIQSCPSLLPLYISVLGGCPCVKDEPLRSEWLCKQNLLSYRIAAISVIECNMNKESAGEMHIPRVSKRYKCTAIQAVPYT